MRFARFKAKGDSARLIIFAAVLCLGCSGTSTAPDNPSSKYYADIELSSMSGIKLLGNEPIYPCVKIDSIGTSERKISFVLNEDLTESRKYIKNGDYWYAVHSLDVKGKPMYFYEYVNDQKRIVLEYGVNKAGTTKFLASMAITKGNRTRRFIYEPYQIQIAPSPDADRSLTDKWITEEITETSIKRGILQAKQMIVAMDTDDRVSLNTRCYQLNELSVNWWYFMMKDLKRIECE